MELKLGALEGHYPDGTKFSDVLAWNHYGTETIPPRPVLRVAAEQTIPMNKQRIEAFINNLMANPRDAKRLETVLLQSLGAQTVANAKKIIEGVRDLQHNAPKTVTKKGFDKPLYVNGDLERHLGYEISEE